MHRSVNGQVPDIKCGDGCKIPMQWAAGWLAMGSGVLITLAVQSSSITTSALTPLVGIGVIQLIETNRSTIERRAGRPIEIVAVNARDRSRDRGVDLSPYAWADDMQAMAERGDIDVVLELVGGSDGLPSHK